MCHSLTMRWFAATAFLCTSIPWNVSAQNAVDSAFLQGARGMVPCNDGSFIGGFINCPTFVNGDALADCPRPVMTRSWDGGRTWAVEEAQTQDYSFPGIVRLQGGVLLTGHNRWLNSFILSADNGHTWYNGFDTATTEPLDDQNYISFNLFRDHRGILYWMSAGSVNMSLDNGRTFCAMIDKDGGRDGFYVLPKDGLIASHSVGSGNLPGSISMSFNHGRSWSVTLRGFDRYQDSTSMLYGAITIRDTFVVNDDFSYRPEGGLYYEGHPRTKFWNTSAKRWDVRKYLGGFVRTALMDSSENLYKDNGNEVYWCPFGDSVTRRISIDMSLNPKPPIPDSLLKTYFRELGLFYDLDGAVHPAGSDIYFPIRKLRPISKLDRLYTCTGIEYVIGGHALDSLWLDSTKTVNADMTYSISPNNRLAFVTVFVVDPTRPMHIGIYVSDSVVRNQVFSDSVMPLSSLPVISLRKRQVQQLECVWLDGPFMWMRNGEPLPKPSLGMNNDSIVENPKPGTYYVVGKSPFGCDVRSNEITIAATDVNDATVHESDMYRATVTEQGSIRVEWKQSTPPSMIRVFDTIGREVESTTVMQSHHADVMIASPSTVYILMIYDDDGNIHCSLLRSW